MRPYLLFSMLFFGVPFAALLAQSPRVPSVQATDILRQPVQAISVFDTSGFGMFQLAIRFPYGSARVLNRTDYEAIVGYGKISVEYIYSRYTQSQPNQKSLDAARFAALKNLAPDLFLDPNIRWDILVQTEATTADSARNLFHGFVITYQPPVTDVRKAEIKKELDLLVDCAKKRPPSDAAKYPGGTDSLQRYLEQNVRFPTKEIKTKGLSRAAMVAFDIDSSTRMPVNIRVAKGVSPQHNEHIKTIVGTMGGWGAGKPGMLFLVMIQFSLSESGKPTIACGPLRGYRPEDCRGLKNDSTVVKVLQRNNQWKKLLVVEDVTGSMMPYVADLLLWNALKGNLQNTRHFVFFNDGDGKQSYEKEVGNTGGIYHTKAKNVDVLEETMISAIAGGQGGDTPENDIEAILAGLAKCPDCEEVVLIADNGATPRDLALLSQVTKPVHVILCGVKFRPNPAHLLIAWKTKGSLHTIQEDIVSLADMQEGESITVMGKTYKIVDGSFWELGRM